MIYPFIRTCLFNLEPEKAHHLTLKTLQFTYQLGFMRFFPKELAPCTVMGLDFPNPIGLSAGFDRNAEYIDALASLGFGFIEIGTVLTKSQTGNPKPRIFRLIDKEALINRIGFASKGLEYVLSQLEKSKYDGILGINIGKHKDTPNEKAIDDYLLLFRALWKFASYITINISSPNTAGLRDLQQRDSLKTLLQTLKQEQKHIFETGKKYVPLVVKLAPDLSHENLAEIAEVLLHQQIDGVIAANTTVGRENVIGSKYAEETGGLSGRPLQKLNTKIIRELHALLQNKIPIIGSGGVMDEAAAREKFVAGASLLQVYTGLIYQGPGLVGRLVSGLPK